MFQWALRRFDNVLLLLVVRSHMNHTSFNFFIMTQMLMKFIHGYFLGCSVELCIHLNEGIAAQQQTATREETYLSGEGLHGTGLTELGGTGFHLLVWWIFDNASRQLTRLYHGMIMTDRVVIKNLDGCFFDFIFDSKHHHDILKLESKKTILLGILVERTPK